jgi:hypothetical protein
MVSQQNLNCEQVWLEISNYVDGEVDVTLRVTMEEHFHTCSKCTSVLVGTQNIVRLYGDERMLEVPAGFSRRLEKRLTQREVKESRWLTWEAWLVPVAAMALLAGGLKVTNQFLFHEPPKSILSPPVKDDIPPDLQVVVSNGSKIFHVPGCSFIHDKNSEHMMTAKEAMQEGYSPCSRCLRQYLKTGVIGESEETVADENHEDQGEQPADLRLGSAVQ